jgi:hypothetical protein
MELKGLKKKTSLLFDYTQQFDYLFDKEHSEKNFKRLLKDEKYLMSILTEGNYNEMIRQYRKKSKTTNHEIIINELLKGMIKISGPKSEPTFYDKLRRLFKK